MKGGQARSERYDDRVPFESPELLRAAISWLSARDDFALHHLIAALGMSSVLFTKLTGEPLTTPPSNVVLFGAGLP